MIYGYIKQLKYLEEDDSHLLMQKEQILKEYPGVLMIEEETDSRNDKKLKTLMENMLPGDLIVCTKLSRFCQDLGEGLKTIEELIEKGCAVHFLDMGVIDDKEAGRFIIKQLLAYEEFKKDVILEQCLIGKEQARKNPEFKEGRPPKYTKAQLDEAVALRAGHTFKQVVEKTGISESTIRRYQKKSIKC